MSYHTHTKEYRGSKKRLYLSPPTHDLTTVRQKITTIIPAPSPPPPPPPFVMPEPPPVLALPPPPPPPPQRAVTPPIEIIAVDVEPSVVSSRRSTKSSRSSSRSHSRHGGSRDLEREVYIERERFVPVRVPVPVHIHHHHEVPAPPVYQTYQYIEAPRRYSPPREERERVVVEDHRRTREYYRTV